MYPSKVAAEKSKAMRADSIGPKIPPSSSSARWHALLAIANSAPALRIAVRVILAPIPQNAWV
jgi:hypothetical protein